MSETPNLGEIVDDQLAALAHLLKFADDRGRIIPKLKDIIRILEDTDG